MRSPAENPALAEAVEAIATGARHLGMSGFDAARHVTDATTALEALDRVDEALQSAASIDHQPTRPGDQPRDGRAAPSNRELLAGIRSARAGLLAHELARHRSMMTSVSDGIARLRTSRTVDDLVESIPIQTVSLGYERAMFSWVDHEYWVPRSAYTLSGAEEARTLVAAGAPPYLHVRDLNEVAVVRDRRAILVLDCHTNPRVHPKILPVSRSQTYVAAPIVARNHVAAFVHLDRSLESGLNDEFDRDLLALFCEGIGAILDQLLASERVVAPDLPSVHVADWVDALTEREREVLRLMAQGLTNAQIGNRLFISHETTKTHVRKILRKLGARTRGEASAMYHELRPDGRLRA